MGHQFVYSHTTMRAKGKGRAGAAKVPKRIFSFFLFKDFRGDGRRWNAFFPPQDNFFFDRNCTICVIRLPPESWWWHHINTAVRFWHPEVSMGAARWEKFWSQEFKDNGNLSRFQCIETTHKCTALWEGFVHQEPILCNKVFEINQIKSNQGYGVILITWSDSDTVRFLWECTWEKSCVKSKDNGNLFWFQCITPSRGRIKTGKL